MPLRLVSAISIRSPLRACSRLRRSGAKTFRWCSTRPPVAMPLAEMMTLGMGVTSSDLDSSTSRT
jgi:hypothetical protein